MMASRLNLLKTMKRTSLAFDLTSAFSEEKLSELANAASETGVELLGSNIETQRELLRNPAFLPALKSLQDSGVSGSAIERFLQHVHGKGETLYAFTDGAILETMRLETTYPNAYYTYLKHFAGTGLTRETADITIANIEELERKSQPLTQRIIDLDNRILTQEYPSQFIIFSSMSLGMFMVCLSENPQLQPLAAFFFAEGIKVQLSLDSWQAIARAGDQVHEKMLRLYDMLDHDPKPMTSLVMRWIGNGTLLNELDLIERRITAAPALVPDCFEYKSAYVDMLYGSKINGIVFSELETHQGDLLIYALNGKKYAFLRLLEKNLPLFLAIQKRSILYACLEFREQYINLNTLNVVNLKALTNMNAPWDHGVLEDRIHTFAEIAALFRKPREYAVLYGKLQIDSVDKRLRIIRELTKHNALDDTFNEDDLQNLAEKLTIMPLSQWTEKHFSHIDGISAPTAAKLLSVYDSALPFIGELQNANDVLLVKRNVGQLEHVQSIADLKASILNHDSAWLNLKELMSISDEFEKKHREKIIEFVCRDGAQIALTYYKSIGSSTQRESLRRIVKAELMSAFHELKYHADDLRRELELKVTVKESAVWRECIEDQADGLTVRECDNFYSTMNLGITPSETCLSYIDGNQRECLLSNFDSNKKILYVWRDNRIVARALIRLTKGKYGNHVKQQKTEETSLSFVNLDSPGKPSKLGQERLVLFLEMCYSAHLTPDMKSKAVQLIIRTAENKASQLGCLLVLSNQYAYDAPNTTYTSTMFSLFISKSKSGAQYNDSLGGSAGVNDEGSYRSNSFLIRNDASASGRVASA